MRMGFVFIKMKIEKLYSLFLQFPKICTDSRKDLKNSIFFCLSGENFNGNQFAAQTLEKGAAFVVVDDKNYKLDDARCIFVSDSLATLQQLASFHRKQFAIPVVGITGTNGKTTTKELIKAVLSKKYAVVATQGNFNNHIGVPLTLLQIDKKTEIAIIEMGANHPDEIEFLCNLALPNYGIITNIGKAHLEGFGSLAAIKKTKLALYLSVISRKGTLFANFDDFLLKKEAEDTDYISYGQDADFDIHGTILSEFPFLELNWELKNQENTYKVSSKLFGNYNFPNILAAISVGHYFKISPEIISGALEDYHPQNNRSQFIKGKNNELIMDAYNANPESLKVALANFSKDIHHSKALILGDMFELGQFAEQEHQTILESIRTVDFCSVVLVGSLFKQFETKYSDFHFFNNTNELIAQINTLNLNQLRILIKGSRGIKLEVLQDYLL